jgi:hypothetical protein
MSAGLSAWPKVAFGRQDPFRSVIEQAFAAQRRGDFVEMAKLLQRVVDAGRTDEGVLRGLAFALCQQWKFSEAIPIALENNRRNPGAWSVAGVCETYVSAGEFEEARKWLQLAVDHKSEWGGAAPIFENNMDQAAIKTYLLEYTLEPALLAKIPFLRQLNGDFLCPAPFPDLPYQTSTYEVIGARSYREGRRAGNLCLRITPEMDQPVHVRYTVTITPRSYRTQVRDFTEAEVPAEIRPLMHTTPNVQVEHELVQSLALPLRSSSAIKSIENVCLWSHNNLKYDGGEAMACGGGTVAVLTRRSGHCEGQTSGSIGLLRALGIPARFVRGHGGIVGTSGVPTDHSWTEFYVPSVGWIQWDQNNPPFTVPAKICIGEFRYTSPYAAPGSGDHETADLWNFEAVAFPAGTTPGTSGNVRYTRIKQSL